MLIKAITSLEKCFPDEYPVSKHGLSSFSMLKNERYSFQVCFRVSEVNTSSMHATVTVDSPLADCVSLYTTTATICAPSPVSSRTFWSPLRTAVTSR